MGRRLRLWLCRHATSVWNKEKIHQGQCPTEPGLAEEGKLQAKRLGTFLKQFEIALPVGTIWTSPLPRAYQTAQIIAHHLIRLAPIKIERGLQEITHGGIDGMPFSEVKECFPWGVQAWQQKISHIPLFPFGETLEAAQQRIVTTIQKIATISSHSILYPHYDDITVIISHGAVINLFLASVNDIPIHRSLDKSQDNACINTLEWNGDRFIILRKNYTEYLGDTKYTPKIEI